MTITYTNQQKLGNNFLRSLGDTMFATSASITVYSGAQPTAVTVQGDWTSYKTSNVECLAHFLTGPSWSYNAGTLTWYNTTNPNATNVYNTGTASWAIIWSKTISTVLVQGSTLPDTQFVVVPVSTATGTGILRMVSADVVPGTTATVTSSGMTYVFA